MKELIIANRNNPEALEQLYRRNKDDFNHALVEVSDEYITELLKFWKIRLAPEKKVPVRVIRTDLSVVIFLSLVSGLLVKLPYLFPGIDQDLYFARNLAVIVINSLILYSTWQNKIHWKRAVSFYLAPVLILILYLNLVPDLKSDSGILSFIHAPLLMWCLFGFAYISFDYRNYEKLTEFIRFNGQLIIMTGLITSAGSLFSGLTVGLFSAIEIDIQKIFFEYIMVIGGVAAPLISWFLIRLYPGLTNKIAPVIAKVFTPLVLVNMSIYIISIIFAGGRLLEERNDLIFFNAMLIAVLAIIVFSISELGKNSTGNINVFILFLLSILTIIINSIALFAITGRALQGLTPNRTVVLLSNLLIFIHLILITRRLYLLYYKSGSEKSVEMTVVRYLPVYAIYAVFVIFILPVIFGFK